MRFKLSTSTRNAIDAIIQEWDGQVPPAMAARLMALAQPETLRFIAAQQTLTELEAIAARPSIKRRKPTWLRK